MTTVVPQNTHAMARPAPTLECQRSRLVAWPQFRHFLRPAILQGEDCHVTEEEAIQHNSIDSWTVPLKTLLTFKFVLPGRRFESALIWYCHLKVHLKVQGDGLSNRAAAGAVAITLLPPPPSSRMHSHTKIVCLPVYQQAPSCHHNHSKSVLEQVKLCGATIHSCTIVQVCCCSSGILHTVLE